MSKKIFCLLIALACLVVFTGAGFAGQGAPAEPVAGPAEAATDSCQSAELAFLSTDDADSADTGDEGDEVADADVFGALVWCCYGGLCRKVSPEKCADNNGTEFTSQTSCERDC